MAATRCAVNPNAEIFASNNTWEWTGKVSGAYTFPLDIIASANYELRSGTPQARRVLLTGGQAIRRSGERGARRQPSASPTPTWWTCVRPSDLPSEGQRRMELRMDIFNALNTNTTLQRVLRSGPRVPEDGRALRGRAAAVRCPGDLVAADCAVRRDVHFLNRRLVRHEAHRRLVPRLRVRRPSRVFPRVSPGVGARTAPLKRLLDSCFSPLLLIDSI